MDDGKTRVEAWAAAPESRSDRTTGTTVLVDPARPPLSPGELIVSEPSAFLSLFHSGAVRRARIGSDKYFLADEFNECRGGGGGRRRVLNKQNFLFGPGLDWKKMFFLIQILQEARLNKPKSLTGPGSNRTGRK